MTKNIKKAATGLIALTAPCMMFGADVAADAAAGAVTAESSLSIDFILCLVSIILLLPLYLATKTFLLVAKGYINTKISAAKKAGVLLLLVGFSQMAFGQAADATLPTGPQSADVFPDHPITWILVIIILLESILIVYFSFLTNRFIKSPSSEVSKNLGTADIAKKEKSGLAKLWDRMNSFQPLTNEASIDTGHSYDGIRELNNITPPWFSTTFILSIIFAAVYLYVYHVGKTAPLPAEEFRIAMAEAEQEKTKMLALQGNNVDENNVTLLTGSDITEGQKLFVEKCVACHAAHGGSMAGGVGPNLTDDYWIHGGSIKDIFKTIKYGWVEKGMISWKDQLSAKQIAQISSFIKSIKGSNPAGAKEPQGELYSEDGAAGAAVATDSTATDSSKIKK